MRVLGVLCGCVVLLLFAAGVAAAGIVEAAEEGDVDGVRKALDAGADPNAVPEETWGPLHIATLNGHEPVVKLLLARGADANLAQFGSLALHLAIDRGHDKIVRLLVAAGSDLEKRDPGDLRPLHVAAKKGNRELLVLLLDEGANIEGVDRYGRTALAVAVDQGDLELTRLLLDRKAKTDARLTDGRRPLHLALDKGHAGITALLLERGASHDLLSAAGLGDVQTLTKLLDRGDPVDLRMAWSGATPLMWAARAGKPKAVKLLLARGASPHAATKSDFKAMHYAAHGGDPACGRALLEAGALVDPKDRRGTTPLHRAAEAGHVAMIAFLAEHGANVNARHLAESFTPLYTAAFHRHAAAVRALLVAKADPSLATSSGKTALHAGLPEPAITRTLLDAGADPNARSKRRRTPLHEAAQEAHVASALLLLERGADPTLSDDRGQTPLHTVALKSFADSLFVRSPDDAADDPEAAAQRERRLALAKALLAKGVDPRAKDKQGRMPYDLAKANGYAALARLLGKAARELVGGR